MNALKPLQRELEDTMGELEKIMRDNQRLVECAQDAAVTSVLLSGAALAISLLTLIALAIVAGT